MKRTSLMIVLATAALLLSSAAMAQDSAAMAQDASDAMARAATPGPCHQNLDHSVGLWKVKGKLWMQPGQPPVEFEGESVSQWILGRRMIETRYRSELFGEPFEGRGLDGYDNLTGNYVSTWADTSSTSILVFKGPCEGDGKVRTLKGEVMDPTTGKPVKTRGVITVIGEDSYKYESYATTPNGEVKSMEILYTKG